MSGRLQIVLGVALTVAAVAAAWMFLVAPKREDAAALGAQLSTARARLVDANARAATAAQARATYARDYATVARLGKAVPVNADVPSLVFQLETAARRAKVDFRAVTASDPAAPAPGTSAAKSGGIQSAPFTFKFVGNYFGLRRLLAEIDRFSRVRGTRVAVSGRLLTIDGMTINPSSKGLPSIQSTVTARAYVAEMPDPLPGANASTTTTTTTTTASEDTP